VVYGILGTALVQGLLTALGLWASGVPRPLLLGVIAGGLSVLPIGAPVVWIPAALWLLSRDHTAWGVFLLVYGTVAISGSDSVIRPFFIARGARLPFLLTMLGVLGGALAFGLLGVFVGPVLLGVGITFSSMALVFNALAKGYDFFTYYFTLFLTPTMFLGGVFFPLEQLPPLVRAVADWLPLANAVALVRPLFMDQWPSNVLHHGGVLVAYAVVSFWLALALTRKRFGQ
jgi:Nod factor-specific ABC transporter NodJ protein